MLFSMENQQILKSCKLTLRWPGGDNLMQSHFQDGRAKLRTCGGFGGGGFGGGGFKGGGKDDSKQSSP